MLAIAIFASLLASAQPASPSPAPWATDRREPLCVFDGLMAGSDAEAEAEPGADRVRRIQTECRQRFGWTEQQSAGGVAAAYMTARALQARDEARAAGVSIETMEQIMASFSQSERALLAPSGERSEANARQFAGLLHQRVIAAGLTGEARNKAAHAIISLMTAGKLVADFSREIGFPATR